MNFAFRVKSEVRRDNAEQGRAQQGKNVEPLDDETIARMMVEEIVSGRAADHPLAPPGDAAPELMRLIGPLIALVRRGEGGGTCMLGTCSEPAIRSHAVQRAALEHIAEQGHVISFESRFEPGEPVSFEARLLGVNRATTFCGLCERHDSKLFKSVEAQPLDPDNHSQPLLLGYRSVLAHAARQRSLKTCLEEFAARARETMPERSSSIALDELAACGRFCFEVAAMYQGLYEQILVGGIAADELRHLSLRLPVQAFASSCFFSPSHGFDGHPLPQPEPGRPRAWMSVSVVPGQDETYASVHVAQTDFEVLQEVLMPLMMLDGDDLAQRLFELAFRFDDGIVVAPAAWASMSESDQERLLEFKLRAPGDWEPFAFVVPQFTASART